MQAGDAIVAPRSGPLTCLKNPFVGRDTVSEQSAGRLYGFLTASRQLFAPSQRGGAYLRGTGCNVREGTKMDWLYLAMVAGFFAATFALVYGLERLRSRK